MKQRLTACRIGFGTGALALTAAIVVGFSDVAAFVTTWDSYAVPLVEEYEIKPLLSVGDRIPETSHPWKEFQMVGIPDGLGAHKRGNRIIVYMNHELTSPTLSEPVVNDPLNRGALVSKLILDRRGNVISGERAYDTVYINDTLIGPAAAANNTTPAFTRFCSGSLAGPEHGFDRHIYLAGEESNAGTFDGLGGLTVAIFDNQAHALPYLGRFAWENTLVQPHTDRWTVIMGMEDGPANLNPAAENSQLYLYVGYKSRKHDATVLERNGLVGGKLHVFRSKNPAMNSEDPFQNGTLDGEWVHIPNAHTLSSTQLEAASDAVGAMTFGRPEDGSFNPRNHNEYFFVTTGEAARLVGPGFANELGRLYSLRLNRWDPTKSAKLEVLYNADAVIAAGGDIAISPDNIDVGDRYLMINEDGTARSRLVMGAKGRDGSIWRFKLTGLQGLDVSSRERVAELDPPGRDGVAVGPGVWETSGIIDTASLFKAGSSSWFGHAFGFGHLFKAETWLFDVQAHAPTTAPRPNTVEDGQLLLMVRDRHHHDFPWSWWNDDDDADDEDDD